MNVGVIGLGCVGIVAAAGFAVGGHDVVGIDIDRKTVNALRNGEVLMYEPGLPELLDQGSKIGKLRFLHTSEISGPIADIIVIATGTPTTDSGGADLGQIHSAIDLVRKNQPGGGIIVMKSTVPPGTGARIAESLSQGNRFEYVSNPEFLREGQAVYDWFHPDRVVIGGTNDESIRLVNDLYHGIDAPVVVTDFTSAEMIKYAANAFLATKISFVNEIAALCDRVDASIDDVTKGISLDPRVGSSFLRAGVGWGGSCFPKDIRALDQLASDNGQDFELLKSVITVNNRQRLIPFNVMREQFGSLSGVKVAVLGLAFKPQTDDIREAPSLDLIRRLADEGAMVSAYDPKAIHAASKSVPDTVDLVEELLACVRHAQAVVLMTEWPEIVEADWKEIAGTMSEPRFLFDGRNALDPSLMRGFGFQYFAVGRRGNSSSRANIAIGQNTEDS